MLTRASAQSEQSDDSDKEIQDYRRWRMYEVALPVGITVFVLVWLVVEFWASGKHPGDALIATTGAGDLLIFAALLVLNVFGAILTESNPNRTPHEVNSTQIVAVFLLLLYAAVRVSYHTVDVFQQREVQFISASVSAAILVWVLWWIDGLVGKLHLTKVEQRIRENQFLHQFN